MTMNEKTYPGLIIPKHCVKNAESKETASKTLFGWEYRELTAADWVTELGQGRTIQISTFVPKEDGKYTHAKDQWKETYFVCADADNIKGVEFLDDGTDKNPDGIEPFTVAKKLAELYPTLKERVFAVAQSVSSMSDDKPPPHLRYRLIFRFDEPITSAEHYGQILVALAKEFPIIPAIERSPAQPVYGNAREGHNRVRIIDKNVLRLADYPYVEVAQMAPPDLFDAPKTKSEQPNRLMDMSLEDYLRSQGVSYKDGGKGKFYVECPYKDGHTGGICKEKDAYVFENLGSWAFYCSHTSCKNNRTWECFRAGIGDPKPDFDKKDMLPLFSMERDLSAVNRFFSENPDHKFGDCKTSQKDENAKVIVEITVEETLYNIFFSDYLSVRCGYGSMSNWERLPVGGYKDKAHKRAFVQLNNIAVEFVGETGGWTQTSTYAEQATEFESAYGRV